MFLEVGLELDQGELQVSTRARAIEKPEFQLWAQENG